MTRIVIAKMVANRGRAWQSLRRFLRGRGDGIRGAAAIEFAAIATLLVVMMLGTLDLGMGFYRKMQVQSAAQAGAQYAMVHEFNESSITAIQNVVKSATTFPAVTVVTVGKWPKCPSSAGLTDPNSNSQCPDGSTAGSYVTVSAQGIYQTIFPFSLMNLTIPDSFTFTAQSTVRIL